MTMTAKRHTNFKDRTGQKHGSWTFVEYAGDCEWLMRCDCGTERIMKPSNILVGTSKSCGCRTGQGRPFGRTLAQVVRPEFEIREFNGHEIRQRTSDGDFDATALCKVAGKKLNDWTRNASTGEYLQALSGSTGIPVDVLIRIKLDGDNDSRGTWIHPRAAMRLAQWLSPKFAILVDGWVLDLVEGKSQQFGQRNLPAPVKTQAVTLGADSISRLKRLIHNIESTEILRRALADSEELIRKDQQFLFSA